MNTSDPVLQIEQLHKTFGAVAALRGIDLAIERGEFLTLLGPSGSGKSTLLMLIAGFEQPSAGRIRMDDQDLVGVPAYKRQIGVVFQNYALFPHLTVTENIAFSLRNLRWSTPAIAERVSEMLQLVRMEGYGDRLPEELSGGQQQRVAMARALAFKPKILLLDEPLGALDRKLREHMHVELRKIHRQLETTLVYVTHDQEEAMVMSDRIAVMNEGRIVRLDTPRALYEDPQAHFVAGFIGEATIIKLTDPSARPDDPDHRVSADPTGKAAYLAVRPEKARLGRPGEGDNAIPATIEETLYAGDVTKVILRLATGEPAIVKLSSDDGEMSLEPGTRTTFVWRREDGRLLHDGPRSGRDHLTQPCPSAVRIQACARGAGEKMPQAHSLLCGSAWVKPWRARTRTLGDKKWRRDLQPDEEAMSQDVPSPIDLRLMKDASAWGRQGRAAAWQGYHAQPHRRGSRASGDPHTEDSGTWIRARFPGAAHGSAFARSAIHGLGLFARDA